MKYELDTRLPLDLFKKAPFVYTGPGSSSFLLGSIQGTISYGGKIFQRFYPLTVYELSRSNQIIDKAFCLCFFYVDNKGEPVLFLSHPCWLSKSEKSSVIDFLVMNVEELAKYWGAKVIEVEFHDEVDSYIAYPTSLTHFSNDLSMMSIEKSEISILESQGFRERKEILCYEQDVNEIEKTAEQNGHSPTGYWIKRITPAEFMMLKRRAVNFPLKAFALSSVDPVITYINPRSIDTISAGYTKKRWFSKGELAGFIRWSPDIFEPSKKHGLPVPLLFNYVLDNYPYIYGKILDWGVSVEDENLLKALFSHTSHLMKNKGLARLQIAYVDGKQSTMKAFLMKQGFRKVHTIKLLRKGVD